MATNTGFLLMAGLGALLFFGRGGTSKTADADSRLVTGQGRGGLMPPALPAFDLQSYVDSLFGEMATVPKQPPMRMFQPRDVLVTSSGVAGIIKPQPDLITPTTRVQIGGTGGETITASALQVLRLQQLEKQRFAAAANVFGPLPGETAMANAIEEARQRQMAQDMIATNIAAQLARNRAVIARTREDQERLANPPSLAALPILVEGRDAFADNGYGGGGGPTVPTVSTFVSAPSEPGPKYSETFVISGGLESPVDFTFEESGFFYSDPGLDYYAPSVTVHEITAAYDIGF